MSSSNAIPVGDTITDGVSIIYVSSNGDDANSGLNSAEPKQTIAAALTAAYGITPLGRRVVKCIDASVFTENVAVSQVVDIEMPHARLNGTLGATSNLGRMSFDIAVVQGNVTVRAFSHYTFEQVSGDLIIENCNLGDSYVHAEDWVTGSVVTTNAAGVVTFNIVHNDANLDIPTDISGFTPKGLVDGEPVNPSEYARSLETLTGDLRLQSSAIHFPDASQVVYVSANGSNSNSGLSVHEAVQTLNQALSVAAGLPTTARRIIACLDGSHFTENFTSANNIDLYLPLATITGNVGGSTGDKTFVRIGTLKGNLTMGTQDTVEVDELQGDISYPSGSHTSYLKIHHFLSGNTTFDSAANGYCHIEIDMPRNATVGAWPSGMYIFGHVGENTYTNGVSLVNELTKLTGPDRLDASAIKNLPTIQLSNEKTFEKLIDEVASKYSIANNDSFTNAATIELFSGALGTPVTVRTTNGRVNGTYLQGSPSAIWCSGGNPPSGNVAFIEVIIPANVISGMDLVLSGSRSSTTGTRSFHVFNGDPTSGGTEVEAVLGSRVNTTSEIRSVVYDLGAIDGEIHLLISRILLSDVKLIPSAIRKNSTINSGSFSDAFDELSNQTGMEHGDTLTVNQVNQCLQGLGVGAYLRTDAGRELPRLFKLGVGRGLYAHLDNQDETTTTGKVVELIIPRGNIGHATILNLGFSELSALNNDRSVSVYYGDPTTGSTKATPVIGTEEHGVYSRVVYNASETPEELGELPYDIHIVIKSACLVNFELAYNDVTRAAETSVTELRGGARPAEFSSTKDYVLGDQVYRSSDNLIYQANQDVTAGAWDASQWGEVSVSQNAVPSVIRDRLQQLTADNRLDASAIKNLPSGGGSQHPYAEFTNMGAGGNGWYDLITWPAVTEVDTSGADFILFMSANNTDLVLTYRVNINTPRGFSADSENTMMRVLGTIETAAVSGAQFRIIRDTESDVNSGVRLQIQLDAGNTYTGLMSSIISLPYPSGANFGGVAKHTPTGSEKVIKEISTGGWKERNIVDGTTGGIACTSVGEHDQASRAWIDFSTGDVCIHAEDQIVQQISSHGTRFSAGEYGTWGTDSPEPAFPTNALSSVTNNKRPNNDDTTGNPLSTVTCNLSDASTGSGLIRWDSVDGYAIIRLIGNTVTNRGSMRHRFDGATIGQKIRVTHKWWKASDATMQHTARLDGPEGPTLKVLTLPSSNPNSAFYTTDFEYTVTYEDAFKGYADIYLSCTGSGTSGYYLYSYRVDIIVDEPALQTNVVGQFDSVYRGVLLPRIVPVSSDEHTRGIVALDELGMRNPIYYNGDNWSNFAVVRNETADAQYGTYYSSELGTGALADQGFEQTTGDAMTVVQDYQGFPQLLRTNSSNIVSIFSTIDDTDAFWQAAWDRGLIVTHRVLGADTGASLHMNIEPRNSSTSWGTGRFTYNVLNDSSGNPVLQLERANGGSANFEVPFSRDVMHTISVFVPPTTGVATVLLDGQVVGTCGLGGFDGQRGICTFTVGSGSRDYYLQQYSITVMEATATAKNFTIKEITDSIRYVVPTTANDFVLTMPKSLMPVGATFSVVNGGSREVTIKGADDDLQLFSGNPIGKIPAGHESTFVQTGFPTGSIWTMSNSVTKRTTTSQGHSLHLKINTAGDVVNRHGTYTANDVQVTRPNTGDYQIAIGGHVFTSTNFTIIATADGASATARRYTASAGLGAIGEAAVWLRDAGGTARNASFNVSIYW